MSFVNTVDIVGDEALANSIIDRSVTEIADNMVTSIGGYAFRACTALTTADFPAATSIGTQVFYGCNQLITADFPAATSIDGSVFYNCKALTTANLPKVTSPGNSLFYGCSALTTVDLSAATRVGSDTFNGCSALTTVDLPAAKSIASKAFYGCSKLTALILRSATMATLSNGNAFTGTPIMNSTGYIYVPRALLDSYQAASNWSTFANQFRALEDYTVDGTTTGALDESKI